LKTCDQNHYPTGISADIQKNIRLVGYSFLVGLLVFNAEMVFDIYFVTPFPFDIFSVPVFGLFAYFIFRINSIRCPNCGKKLGNLYGFIPFEALHDFDLVKCKHCHYDLT